MGRKAVAAAVVAFAGLAWLTAASCSPVTSAAAGALLHPYRRAMREAPPQRCTARSFTGDGVRVEGWQCSAPPHRATIVLLHGVADTRASWRAAIGRFSAAGYDVIAYDSRAHGESTGTACTYGFFEKADLKKVIDASGADRVVLFGASLGAAVALQEAPDDARVVAVVAAETFSDLRTVATERAPRLLTKGVIRDAFAMAERDARFVVDDVSPVHAASRIKVPVLLIHGAADEDTPADHSRRVFAALAGPKRLLLVPGVGHNRSLSSASVWNEIDRWIAASVSGQSALESAPDRLAR